MDKRPKIVVLCGSTKFTDYNERNYWQEASLRETLAGNIVLSIGCDMRRDADVFARYSEDELKRTKARLDVLHYQKIDIADEAYILNVGGYIGESTMRELYYALAQGKTIRYLETVEDD